MESRRLSIQESLVISATIRDISIILLALQTLIVNILLAVLIWQVYRLVKMVQTEIKPMIEDTQETLGSVRGTANFVGESVVEPVVRSSRAVAGIRGTMRSLTRELTPQSTRSNKAASAQPPAAAPETTSSAAAE
jgi:hypothetical protein